MGDRIAVPLDLDDFEVLAADLVDGELWVEVESTLPPSCFHCGSVEVAGHGRATRRLRDRSCRYPVVRVWRQRRFKCRDCGRTSRERHREVAGRRRVTRRFLCQLGEEASTQPWTDVASRETVVTIWGSSPDAIDIGLPHDRPHISDHDPGRQPVVPLRRGWSAPSLFGDAPPGLITRDW